MLFRSLRHSHQVFTNFGDCISARVTLKNLTTKLSL
jgi:hypothetical protein